VKALVTGGAGFIGSNLARALLARGDEVRILDNLSTGNRGNVADLDVDLLEGDLRSYERVSAATKDVEVVFHQGALPSVPRSVQDPLTSNAVNVDGTLNVLLASRDRGVRRVVMASSSSVYGNAPGMPRSEQGPIAPLAPYAVSKLAAEQYSLAAYRTHGLETVALRYFNVFGERQDPFGGYAAVIPRFAWMMLEGQRPSVFGDGSASRDFTYIENVLAANLSAAVAPSACGRVFNVATGQTRTINDLVRELNRLLDTDLTPEYLPPRAGDVSMSQADISAAAAVLGYEPKITFETGLERTVAWIADHRDIASASP
jgi:nucleoside-diphosphate-sugar epimerase